LRGLFAGLCDDNAFAGGESVCLDHERSFEQRKCGLHILRVLTDRIMRRGNVLPPHELLGEALAALELRGGFGGSEDAKAAALEFVDDAEIEWDLRANDGQIHAKLLRERDESRN